MAGEPIAREENSIEKNRGQNPDPDLPDRPRSHIGEDGGKIRFIRKITQDDKRRDVDAHPPKEIERTDRAEDKKWDEEESGNEG